MVLPLLLVAMGIWFLYRAWNRVVPDVWNPGSEPEVGKRMRGSTRAFYLVGGVLLLALALLFAQCLGQP
jgi:hypothetical protein